MADVDTGCWLWSSSKRLLVYLFPAPALDASHLLLARKRSDRSLSAVRAAAYR